MGFTEFTGLHREDCRVHEFWTCRVLGLGASIGLVFVWFMGTKKVFGGSMEFMGFIPSRDLLAFRGGMFSVWRVCRRENVHKFWGWGS